MDGGWVCHWRLEGLDDYLHASFGVDSIEALDQALHDAPRAIEEAALACGGQVTYLGHRRLGFGRLCADHLRDRVRLRRRRRQQGAVLLPIPARPATTGAG
jgi:hypothetical protein